MNIEQTSVLNFPLKLYLYSAESTTKKPLLQNTIDIWYKTHQHIKDPPSISRFSPILGNAHLDLYMNDNFLTFDQLFRLMIVRELSWSSDIPDTCVKCLNEKGTLFHCVWECPKLNEYWKTVVETVSEAEGINPNDFSVNSKQMTLIDLGILQARRMTASS